MTSFSVLGWAGGFAWMCGPWRCGVRILLGRAIREADHCNTETRVATSSTSATGSTHLYASLILPLRTEIVVLLLMIPRRWDGLWWANSGLTSIINRVANRSGTVGNDSLVGCCFVPWAKNCSWVRNGWGLRCGGVVEQAWKLGWKPLLGVVVVVLVMMGAR